MTHEEIVEGIIKQHVRDAKHGDRTAADRLHELLAERLRRGELTPYMIDLLATMHETIAQGSDAEAAMFTKAAQNRRIKETHKHDVYLFVESEGLVWLFRSKGASPQRPPTLKSLYVKAAKKFNLDEGTIENIYLAQRSEHGSLFP
jgi:hypothetical protein